MQRRFLFLLIFALCTVAIVILKRTPQASVISENTPADNNTNKQTHSTSSIHENKNEQSSTAQTSQRSLASSVVQDNSGFGKRLNFPKTNSNHVATNEPTQLNRTSVLNLESKWQWVENVTAVPKNKFNGSLSNVVAEVNSYLLLSDSKNVSSAETFFENSPMVLYNENRKQYGLLTGVFIVSVKSNEDFESIIKDDQFKIVQSFSNIHTIFLKPKESPFSLNDINQQLNQDHRVLKLEYEILMKNLVKN